MGYEAIIETGGRQFAVGKGDILRVPHLAGSAGDKINFERVLLVRKGDQTRAGQPVVAGAKVAAEILAQEKADTQIVFKLRRRHNSRKRNGHRQEYTKVRITAVHA
ncbi:MAG TPA: 50S ribosomal protein L21 [bacterium]|nr:50S ribosomal protein L21 [bacterium]